MEEKKEFISLDRGLEDITHEVLTTMNQLDEKLDSLCDITYGSVELLAIGAVVPQVHHCYQANDLAGSEDKKFFVNINVNSTREFNIMLCNVESRDLHYVLLSKDIEFEELKVKLSNAIEALKTEAEVA